MENKSVVVERVFPVSSELVWKAITDRDAMSKWYFDIKEFRPEEGFEFDFWAGTPHRRYQHFCRVTSVNPNRSIAYTWRYEGYEGNSLVTFDVFKEDQNTRIRVTHEGLETFPQNNRDLMPERFEEGWTYIIGTALEQYLMGLN